MAIWYLWVHLDWLRGNMRMAAYFASRSEPFPASLSDFQALLSLAVYGVFCFGVFKSQRWAHILAALVVAERLSRELKNLPYSNRLPGFWYPVAIDLLFLAYLVIRLLVPLLRRMKQKPQPAA